MKNKLPELCDCCAKYTYDGEIKRGADGIVIAPCDEFNKFFKWKHFIINNESSHCHLFKPSKVKCYACKDRLPCLCDATETPTKWSRYWKAVAENISKS